MPDKDREIAGLPIGGVFVILAFLLGYFILPDHPFKTSRQSTPDAPKSETRERSHVEARLWEDPYSAIKRSGKPDAAGANYSKFNELSDLIVRKLQQNPDEHLVVLCVMALAGEYAENLELRRRSRYAVLSAMAAEGYSPDSPDRLYYVDFRKPESDRSEQENPTLLEVMPYESFSLDHSMPHKFSAAPHVVVLWLNEDQLRPQPLMQLSRLISRVRQAVDRAGSGQAFADKLKFKILGPVASTTLKAIIEENVVLSADDRQRYPQPLHEVEMFCWGATADESLLLGGYGGTDLSEFIRKNLSVRFFRTIGTDRQLMEALVAELKLRGVDPLSDHIVLISEWDTHYGRYLPRAFAQSAGMDITSVNIHRVSYLRGIDGQVSTANESAKPSDASSQGNSKGSRPAAIEQPVGNSQFDYLRRLARDLKKIDAGLLEKGQAIKAVGILGSDIYDKLLVLQASRELFPGALFFTTDMDARFLHPDELQFTSNLLIASSFGLSLNPVLNRNTPPFRDSYQTALFFSTRLAMLGEIENQNISECLSGWLRVPRIFEVGRSDAFDLLPEERTGNDAAPACDWLNLVWGDGTYGRLSIHPSHPYLHSGNLRLARSGLLRVAATALIFLLMLYLVAVRGWDVEKETSSKVRLAIGAVLCLIILGGILIELADGWRGGGEPFGLLEGISIWPTVYLRLVAFLVAGGLIVTICRRSRKLEREVRGYFQKSEAADKPPAGAGPENSPPTAGGHEKFWEDYCRRSRPLQRFKRILFLVVPYALVCGSIIYAFGPPFVPFRGAASQWAHFVSLFLSILAFIVLLFWVVDATSLAVWVIKKIGKGFIDWSENAKADIAQRFGIKAEGSQAWIGLEVVVKVTEIVNKFIYYPVLVIILLGISRLTYFDRWDMPPGLLIVILIGLGLSISCAIRLRRRAEQLRKDVLTDLWERQLRSVGTGAESQKIDLLISHIKSIRCGAFAPFLEQPWVRATFIFLTSGSGLTALQFLPWFQ